MTDDTDFLARAALTRLSEPGDTALVKAVAAHGPLAVYQAITGGGALPPEMARRDPAGYRVRTGGPDPQADLDRAAAVGARFLVPGGPGWPTQLNDLGTSVPLGLWVRGALPLRPTALRSVAVVGSRACTDYGLHVAADLCAGLADRGWTVLSGGAYGIDGAAHRGCLAVGGTTVAILASGIDTAYPRGHEALLSRIAETGLLLSELPPGQNPTRYRFIERNRLIAALTRGSVVVEAALRSGALSTARRAQKLGRLVMAVPGPVTSAASAGVHQLLREEGTRLVSDAAEVAEHIGRIGADLAPVPSGPVYARDDLDPETARVLEAVPPHAELSAAATAREAAVGPAAVHRHLADLVGRGLVEHTGKGWRRCPTFDAPTGDGDPELGVPNCNGAGERHDH